ncbi:STAS domain-containing protein [Actinomadura kijaniata]|uniref:STAS domain-containing protein n=1 Tax=Actinomadura kijaniata TaxID=46161 RepID=UPI003F1DAD3F
MERRQGWVMVGLTGELDHTTTGLLDAKLAGAAARVLGISVALELAHLTFTNLAGLGLLVIWWRRLTRAGGRLVLLNPTGRCDQRGLPAVVTAGADAGSAPGQRRVTVSARCSCRSGLHARPVLVSARCWHLVPRSAVLAAA